MNVSVDLDVSKINQKINTNVERTQKILDLQVAKDSNYYCPEDVGILQDSVLLGSDFGSGELIWNIEYAKEQYYGKPNKSTDKNPNARMKWFEEAKATKLKEWIGIANGEYNK
jgi:hypothetical protein